MIVDSKDDRQKAKTKDRKQKAQSTKHNIWGLLTWSDMKRKEKKKRWEKKWNLYRRKVNDWDAERKMSDWNASLEMNERFLRRKNTWLTANDGVIWFRYFDDEELDGEFDHLIDDRIRPDSQWYKTMIWLSWWCSWCYHLLQWTQSYEMYSVYCLITD